MMMAVAPSDLLHVNGQGSDANFGLHPHIYPLLKQSCDHVK